MECKCESQWNQIETVKVDPVPICEKEYRHTLDDENQVMIY